MQSPGALDRVLRILDLYYTPIFCHNSNNFVGSLLFSLLETWPINKTLRISKVVIDRVG